MKPIVATDTITIFQGEARDWTGHGIDLVFTNPYGPLPAGLRDHPMVIHQWIHRKAEAEIWCGNALDHCVGTWNRFREAFWSANIDPEQCVSIDEFVPEQPGWYPEEMARRLLTVFGEPGMTVWDGFMGRGTVGKIAVELGMQYVGVERLDSHLAIAREYLNV